MEEQKKGEKGNSSGAASASSSPSHEFSFTISLHSSTSTTTTTTSVRNPENYKEQQSPLAIDLTPADEIFFHGHLLPLHFLSHLHAAGAGSSPRHSTNSIDSFTLPIRDMLHEHEQETNPIDDDIKPTPVFNNDDDDDARVESFESKGRKPSFSLFKWRKGSDSKERENQYQQEQQKIRKGKFDVSQFVKRYVKMVKPLLSPKGGGGAGGRRENVGFRKHTYSFSGAVSPRDRRENRGRRGEFSAPASMRTSPTNSGLLLANAGVPSPSSDSTMEELQAAIQAAIAHCKNSIGGAPEHNKSPAAISVPVT